MKRKNFADQYLFQKPILKSNLIKVYILRQACF